MLNMEYFNDLKQELLNSIVSYMEMEEDDDFNAYTQDEIDVCEQIIDTFLDVISEEGINSDEILEEVEKAVLKLNELNDNCTNQLIETEQREALCELIIEASRQAGYEFNEDEDDDITARWRQW